jgi:hypothetical protein
MIVIKSELQFSDIVRIYGQYQLLSWYVTGEFDCDSPVKNPFREDTKPSLSVVDAEIPYFFDHALYTSGNWLSAAALYHEIINIEDYVRENIYLSADDYFETLQCVRKDIEDGLLYISTTHNTTIKKRQYEKGFDISINKRYWAQYDADYWNPIPIKTLIEEKVIPVASVYMPKRMYALDNKRENPTYAYVYDSGMKIYKPLDKSGNKWKSKVANTTLDITNGADPYSNLPKILCTSKKDRLVIQLATKMITYSYQSEGVKPEILPNTISIIPDNDKAGMLYAESSNLPVWQLQGGKDAFEIAKNNPTYFISQIKILCQI